MATALIYGSYGYTGSLIAREAVKRGLKPVLAGRDAGKLEAQALELGLEGRMFSLDSLEEVAEGLGGVTAVLHCAGPFSKTARPMAEACFEAGVHYLDITGEIEVFERLAGWDARALTNGVTLLPGVGFDVVPSDCLALYLKERLPGATRLKLAFEGLGGVSRGTARTALESFLGGAVRKNGKIVSVPAAYKTRQVDFGEGPRTTVTIPWGDVATAYHSTGIPNVEVYMAAPARLVWAMRASRYLNPLLKAGPVQRFLEARIQKGPAGPDERTREGGRTLLWGEVTDEAGGRAEARLRTPEGYKLTVLASLLVLEKVLAGDVKPGFQTPAAAYGAELVLELDGVERWE